MANAYGYEHRHRRCEHDFEYFLDMEQLETDLVLVVGEASFPVSKTFLFLRVPLFRRLIEPEDIIRPNRKAEQLVVALPNFDVSADVFDRYLRYVYMPKVPEVGDLTIELLKIAEMFQDEFLSALCKTYLFSRVAPTAVIDCLKKLTNENEDANASSREVLSLKEACIKNLFAKCINEIHFPLCGCIEMEIRVPYPGRLVKKRRCPCCIM